MEQVLRGLTWKDCLVYIDDIICAGCDISQTVRRLYLVLEQLKTANLSLKPKKCKWFKQCIVYLGHMVSKKGIQPNPENVKAVLSRSKPQNKDDVRSFLGAVGYYRAHVEMFGSKVEPIQHLVKKDASWQWTAEREQVYRTLLEELASSPGLSYPIQVWSEFVKSPFQN